MTAKYRIYFYFLCQQGEISPPVVLSGGSGRPTPPGPPLAETLDTIYRHAVVVQYIYIYTLHTRSHRVAL